MWKLIYQFLKFGIVGLANTIISLAIYYFLTFINVKYILATIMGYLISSVIGFVLNKFWVFRLQNSKAVMETIKYYIVYGCALLINISMMYLQVDILSISDKIAPLITLCVTIPFNFLMSRLWVFRQKGQF